MKNAREQPFPRFMHRLDAAGLLAVIRRAGSARDAGHGVLASTLVSLVERSMVERMAELYVAFDEDRPTLEVYDTCVTALVEARRGGTRAPLERIAGLLEPLAAAPVSCAA